MELLHFLTVTLIGFPQLRLVNLINDSLVHRDAVFYSRLVTDGNPLISILFCVVLKKALGTDMSTTDLSKRTMALEA